MQDQLRPFAKANIAKTVLLLAAASAAVLIWGSVLASAAGIAAGACLTAFLVSPVAKFFERKLDRPLACLLALAAVFLVLLGLMALLLPALSAQLQRIAEMLPGALSRLQGIGEALLQGLRKHFPEISLPKPDFSAAESGIGSIARQTISYAGSMATGAYRLVLTLILSYFLMADRERVLLRLELAVPLRWRRLAIRMGGSLLRQFRLYLRGQALVALSVAALAAAALLLIGVQAAPLLGLVVGLFNVIPYFGPFIGGIPAFIMALSISWQKAALTVLALFLVQQADGLVLSPRIMGGITGFSPAVVLLGIYLGQQAAGIWGMLLAMPVMMAARTVYRVFVQRHENN